MLLLGKVFDPQICYSPKIILETEFDFLINKKVHRTFLMLNIEKIFTMIKNGIVGLYSENGRRKKQSGRRRPAIKISAQDQSNVKNSVSPKKKNWYP